MNADLAATARILGALAAAIDRSDEWVPALHVTVGELAAHFASHRAAGAVAPDDRAIAAALLAAAHRERAVPEVACPACGATIRARLADQPDALPEKPMSGGDHGEDVERLRAENERLNRHLRVWHQGFQDAAPAKRLLSDILAVVNRHQGANAEQAMEEIHEACMATLAAVPSPPASDGEQARRAATDGERSWEEAGDAAR